jgi:hypothetical protein
VPWRSARVKVKNASISKAVSSRGSRFEPKNVDCQLSIAPSKIQGAIASLNSRTASSCSAKEIGHQPLLLPINPTVCYCTKIKGTPSMVPAHNVLISHVESGLAESSQPR